MGSWGTRHKHKQIFYWVCPLNVYYLSASYFPEKTHHWHCVYPAKCICKICSVYQSEKCEKSCMNVLSLLLTLSIDIRGTEQRDTGR